MTEVAIGGLADYLETENPRDAFAKRLARHTKNGFVNYEGNGDGSPVRHEGSGVYRIAEKLFRLVGFYASDDGRRAEFIVINSFRKRGQRLNAADRQVIADVAETKAKGNWKKREHTDEGDRPDPEAHGGSGEAAGESGT